MLEAWTAVERERERRLQDAWARYHGAWKDQADYGWPKPLKSTRTDPQGADNTRLNLAKLLVNKSTSFLFGSDLDFEIDAGVETPEEEWLEACLDANRRMTFLHRLGVNGGVCGQTFIKVMLPDPAANGHPYPRLVLWDPARVRVRWDPRDYERVLSFTHSWQGVDPQRAVPVFYRQRVERLEPAGWDIVDEESTGSAVSFRESGRERWPWPWCPVLTCQNLPCPNEWWGQADLEEDILHVNEVLNFVASNLGRILRVHAHPRTWGAGFSGEKLSVAIDSIALLPAGAELHNLEMVTDLTSTLEYLRKLQESFHELTRLPEVATGKVENLGQLSGLAIKILYGPLVELTQTKRLTYGELLRELCMRLLEMGGFGPDRMAEPQWPEVIPQDPLLEAQTAVMYDQLGVSRDTILTRLGFDPAAEAEKRQEQDAQAAATLEDRLTMFDRGGAGPVPGRGAAAADSEE